MKTTRQADVTETINGLHSCKPGNEPQVGQIKTFVIEHHAAKGGKKPWIKIKSAGEKFGGEPYRILSAEPTGYTDDYGNISFNIEIEPAVLGGGGENTKSVREAPLPPDSSNGVDETRRHLMQSANLMLLAIKATMYVGEQVPEALRTEERYGAILGQLFKEASNKRTNDGVNWWSYVDRMPDKPIK